jgi:hypothetical protein
MVYHLWHHRMAFHQWYSMVNVIDHENNVRGCFIYSSFVFVPKKNETKLKKKKDEQFSSLFHTFSLTFVAIDVSSLSLLMFFFAIIQCFVSFVSMCMLIKIMEEGTDMFSFSFYIYIIN